jgi:tetratricopeptide (TPR) repeat protein
MQRTGEELLAVAEATGDVALIARARWRVAFALLSDDPAKARSHFESALSSEGALPGSLRTLLLTHLARCLRMLGYIDQALNAVRQAEQAFTQGGIEPWQLAASHLNLGAFYAQLGDGNSSLRHANAAESVAEKYGLAEIGSSILTLRAWALALLGRHDDVLALVRAFRGSNLSSYRMRVGDLLAMGFACLEAGLIEDGVRLVEGFGSNDERLGMLVAVDLLNGRLLLRSNPPDLKGAESCLQRNLQWCRAANAKFGELLCVTALAGVLRDTGRRSEARALLGEVYGWFTEGFDNRYLKEAKALLDELTA